MQEKNEMKFMKMCLKHIVCTKNRNDDIDAYHENVLKSYYEIKNLYDTAVKEDVIPDQKQIQEVYEKLLLILKTKKVPEREQSYRIQSLLSETGIEIDV